VAELALRFRLDLVQQAWDGSQAGRFASEVGDQIGVNRTTAKRMLVAAGGVPPRRGRNLQGRYLSFAEREEIAVGVARHRRSRTCEPHILEAYRSVMETQTRTSGTSAAALGLGSVLVGSLPAALLTDHAPDRYTVEAVFTRRPERDELTEILGSETRDRLKRAGYPTVELTVTDRRLEIGNTNLEELKDGLATVIADLLAEISAGVRARRDAAAIQLQDAAASENTRAAAVAALAESITFGPSPSANETGSPQDSDINRRSYREQIDNWRDEGGHGH